MDDLYSSIGLSSNWKQKVSFYLKKSFISLGITLLFALFSLYPRLGYDGEVLINGVYPNFRLLYCDVDVTCNITFNPFLFPLSWLIGSGQPSYRFMMRTIPKGVSEFGITWPSLEETKEDALLIVTLNGLFINIPYNFIIFIAAELLKIRSIYLCFLGGIVGFTIGGFIGALIGFSIILLITILLTRKFKNKKFIEIWDAIWKTNSKENI